MYLYRVHLRSTFTENVYGVHPVDMPVVLSLPAKVLRSCSVLVRLRLYSVSAGGRAGRMNDVVAGDLRMQRFGTIPFTCVCVCVCFFGSGIQRTL